MPAPAVSPLGAAAAAGLAPGFAASTSDFTMRPRGPVPDSAARSMPFCVAMRRAKGEAKIRLPSWLGADGALGAVGAASALGVSTLVACSVLAGVSAFLGASAFTASPIFFIAAEMSTSPGFSSSPNSTAMGAFTFTPSLPSGTRILPMRPSSTASNSMVALSVSISARMSPDLTLSPSFTSQRASLPSSMVGDSAGIRMLVATGSILVANRFHRLDHILDGGKRQLLQIGGVRHRHILARDFGGRRIEIVERIQRHARADFRTDGADRPRLLHRDDAVGLLDRSDHRLDVQR